MAKRETVRPGVVYGPVRPSGRRDRSTILGSLLGLLVIVVTIGLLAAGAYFFLLTQNPSASASPTAEASAGGAGASAEPSPAASATTPALGSFAPAASESPVPSAGAPASPATTPQPTIFVPQVQVGPGYVTFGSQSNKDLEITDPHTTFAIDEPIVWSAELTEPANTAELSIRILKLDPAEPDGQRLVRTDPVKPVLKSAHIFLRKIKPIGASEGAGLYTVEYVRGDEVLSAGSFLVLEGS